VGGECTADVTATINALAPATYQAVITAIGVGGIGRGTPIVFTR
jgi:hypothetical protein